MTNIARSVARRLLELARRLDGDIIPNPKNFLGDAHQFSAAKGSNAVVMPKSATKVISEESGRTSFRAPDGYVTTLRRRDGFISSAGGERIRRMIEDSDANIRRNLSLIDELDLWIKTIDVTTADLRKPQWNNDHLPVYDAVAIAAMLVQHTPTTFLEIGSGNSTKFARSAIEFFGLQTKIVSIDPYPREEIDTLCDIAIRKPLEEACDELLSNLQGTAVVYFDGSHRLLPNSDVTVFFTEVLPAMPDGTVYGIHDINLPWDYYDEFIQRLYNEQYMLAAYLLGGADGDSIELPVTYLTINGHMRSHVLIEPHACLNGESFWLKRGGTRAQ